MISVDGDLGEALGQAFVERAFGADSKERTLQLVKGVEKALEKDIADLPWMTEATKQQALIKLQRSTTRSAIPSKWRDYTALRIVRGDALGNSLRGNEFENKRQQRKSASRWIRASGFTVRLPSMRTTFLLKTTSTSWPGILQPPFYEASLDDAVNYGAIGSVIGHELTHGFDDQGRQYRRRRQSEGLVGPQDEKAFNERTECEIKEYGDFTVPGGEHLNGKLTLGENTADNGGLRVAYMALLDLLSTKPASARQPIDGFTPEQRFFLGWSQIWCANATDQVLRLQVQTDPHSPSEFRVNGSVSNFDQFQQAFACKAGQPMVRANACRVW